MSTKTESTTTVATGQPPSFFIGLRIPMEMKAELDEVCHEQMRTRSAMLRVIVLEYLAARRRNRPVGGA